MLKSAHTVSKTVIVFKVLKTLVVYSGAMNTSNLDVLIYLRMDCDKEKEHKKC